MICKASFHRMRYAQSLMHAAEIPVRMPMHFQNSPLPFHLAV